MKQEILVKLKTAEEETAQRVEKAKERAAEILKGARGQADEIRRKALEEAKRDQDAQIKAERTKLEQERDKVLGEGHAREEKLRARYQKEVDAAVKKAMTVFSRSVDA